MNHFLRFALVIAPFGSCLLWSRPSCAEEAPHRLVFFLEHAPLSAALLDRDGHHDVQGSYSGVSAGYSYRALDWLELGAALGYGQTDYVVSDQGFVGGKARAAFESDELVEVGLSLSVGVLTLVVPNLIDDQNNRTRRDHYFVGIAGATGPDLRCWVLPSLAVTLATELAVALVDDLAGAQGNYLATRGLAINLGTIQVGVVVRL